MQTRDLFEFIFFGTEPKKLVRTTDPDTSHAAANTVDTSQLESMVYEVISKYPDGCIADDVERELAHLRSRTTTPRNLALQSAYAQSARVNERKYAIATHTGALGV